MSIEQVVRQSPPHATAIRYARDGRAARPACPGAATPGLAARGHFFVLLVFYLFTLAIKNFILLQTPEIFLFLFQSILL